MKIHLVDGTYELFRAYYGVPGVLSPDGIEVGAVRGLVQTLLSLLRQDDVTHVGCAFDSVVESFRNKMFPGYKTSDGMPEDIKSQFLLAERAAKALGVVVWPMVDFEADDAIASAVNLWKNDSDVDQIIICSPDKDLAQMVIGTRVVLLDRRRRIMIDEEGVKEKFGVCPGSIADYLALVGDTADGIPGIPKWGAKTASVVLSRYKHIEAIPESHLFWDVEVRGAKTVAENLMTFKNDAFLYRDLATLRLDVPIAESTGDMRWVGAKRSEYEEFCNEMGFDRLVSSPHQWL
ncbi:MAG: flap endonuclease [Dehalococcoidia bacterium]|nr:flap endonuclease [Dehalococcoidia bacterium]